ncbi:S8 family serine peptidase [Micromonospora sp. ALFpr18c]|uniref:S8 family serine peptidase n=1 Tax=unclassified Micromonospora TaxID=2617518 RepID=UPI001788C184|nr:S8 family serine peptidase [Micromonospora sp. ALFpr18c]
MTRPAAAQRLLFSLAAAALAILGPGMTQAAQADADYVKYYVVTSAYQGAPENLGEIAGRFLGSDARSTEIFDLNVGRVQPDGNKLSDPNRLTAGWRLVMPWDAVGQDIRYTGPATQGSATTPGKPQGDGAATGPGQIPDGGLPPGGGSPPSGMNCAGAASTTRLDWAALRLAADQAWPQSRGKGQVVAILDSGVDGKLPQLVGRVSAGHDMADGKSRGDVDCLGTGSSMAGLIVAQKTPGSELTGMAPDASVLPIRVRSTAGGVLPTNVQAQAVTYAVSAGATVIALGPAMDAGAPEVATALKNAVMQNVVVVVGAKTEAGVGEPPSGPGVLRVAGVSADMQAADAYRKGGIDIVAPGVNVTSLGVTGAGGTAGTGTYYAVAFAAGEAALVRAAYPDLTASQVTHRVQATADQVGEGTRPDGSFGWGMINPAASVTEVLAEENDPVATESDSAEMTAQETHGYSFWLVVVILITLGAAGYLVWRMVRLWRGRAEDMSDVQPAAPVQFPSPVMAGGPQPHWNGPVESADATHWTDDTTATQSDADDREW